MTCDKCFDKGVQIKWRCGLLRPLDVEWQGCPDHHGCWKNDGFGNSMEHVRCDCPSGLKADLEEFRCSKCKKHTALPDFWNGDEHGKLCCFCGYMEVSQWFLTFNKPPVG